MNETPTVSQLDLPRSTAVRRNQLWFLAAILVIGMWLRCWQAGESLWLDELHTSWVVADTLAEVPERARAGNQSPLYFCIVWGITQLLGHSQWTLRLVSLISGTALIGAVAWLVRRWTGLVSVGLIAAVILALNRDCIFYAQEARPYALVQLSALLQSAIFVRMIRQPRRVYRLLFVVGSGWLFYLHYTTFLLLIAQVVCLLLLWTVGKNRVAYGPRQAIVDFVLIALLLVPASEHLFAIAQRRDNWARIVHAWPPPSAVQSTLVLYGVVPLSVVTFGRFMGWRWGEVTFGSICVVWTACWFFMPFLLAWLATLSQLAALNMVRYLVASLVGAIVFAALCQAAFPHRMVRALLAMVLIVGTVWTSGVVQQLAFDGRVIGDRNEAWDEATRWLDGQLTSTPLPVFLCAGLIEDSELDDYSDSRLIQYCLFPLNGIYQIDASHIEPLPTTTAVRLLPAQRTRIARNGGMWLMVRAGPKTTGHIVAGVCRALESDGFCATVTRRRLFGSLAILQIAVSR